MRTVQQDYSKSQDEPEREAHHQGALKKGAPGRCGQFDLPTVENLPKALGAFGLTVSHHGKLELRRAPLRRCLKRSRGAFGGDYRIRTYDAERLYCDFRQAENGGEQAQRIFDAL